MDPHLKYLTNITTVREIVRLLGDAKFQGIPIVDNQDNRLFLGCISRKMLISFVYRRFYERHGEVSSHNMPEGEGFTCCFP